MEGVHQHGDFLDVGNFLVEGLLTTARDMAELRPLLIGRLTRRACRLQDVRSLDTRDAHQVLPANILQEQIVTEARLVGAPQMAEAGVGWHAADAHDKRGVAARRIVWIGVRSVAEHQVKAVERIDVTRMGAEHDARCDGLRILGDVVGLSVEGEKRLAHRQEELLQRGDGGRVIERDFLEYAWLMPLLTGAITS